MNDALNWFYRKKDRTRGMTSAQEHLLKGYERFINELNKKTQIKIINHEECRAAMQQCMNSTSENLVADHFIFLSDQILHYKNNKEWVKLFQEYRIALIALIVYAAESPNIAMRLKLLQFVKTLPV